MRDDVRAAAVIRAGGDGGEIGQAAEADDLCDGQRIGGGERAVCRQAVARGEPEREMPARRMAGRDHAGEVERMSPRLLAQPVGGGGDVAERAGITAAIAVDAAIVDIPNRDARLA